MSRCIKIFILSFCIAQSLTEYDGFDEESYKQAADFLKEGYNASAEPCKNFTSFACGKWYEKVQIDRQDDEQIAYLDNIVRKAMRAVKSQDESTQKYKVWVKSFYDACLGNKSNNKAVQIYEELIEVLGTPPLFGKNKKTEEFLKRNVWYLVGFVQREFPFANIFFRASVQTTINSEHVKDAVLYLLGNYRLIQSLEKGQIEKTTRFLASIFKLNFDQKKFSKQIDDVVKFERALAKFANDSAKYEDSYEERAKDFELESRVDFSGSFSAIYLNDTFPNISWSNYFHGLFSKIQYESFNESSTLVFVDSDDYDFFSNVSDVVNQFNIETIYNYIFYQIFKNSYEFMTADSQCTKTLRNVFQSAVVRMVFDHTELDPIEWRNDILLIKESVFSAARFMVSGATWLDDADKLKVIAKINQITFNSGIPEWITNDTEIEKRTIAFNKNLTVIQNIFRMLKGNFERNLNYLVGIEDANSDPEPTLAFDANYYSMHIRMYFGYCFLPWYNPKYPLAVKYGQIGSVIAHELTHAFDINGIQEQPKYLTSWLSENTLKRFNKNIKCIVQQYAAFCSREHNDCLSGVKTASENLADIDGLKIAYIAYKFASVTVGRDNPLPGLTELSSDQIYFLTYGRSNCATLTDVESWFDSPDTHAPYLARLNLPLKNFHQFSVTFNCPVNSVYSADGSCTTFGDYIADRQPGKRVKRTY